MLTFIAIKASSLGCCLIFVTAITRTATINNGFSIKFSPLLAKEELKTKGFNSMFAKIPQDLPPHASQAVFTRAVIPADNFGIGCTNQIAKLFTKSKITHDSEAKNPNFINIPILKHNFEKYHIIVVTAPEYIKISRNSDAKPVIVYIVFFQDDIEEIEGINIPSVYFVKSDKEQRERQEKVDPVFIIDSNRTVTGLKSKGLSKFIQFRSKFVNQIHQQEP